MFFSGERPKKPIPLQDQTVRDEKGRYKRFHGAFSGGFSAGYFNTVGSKEGMIFLLTAVILLKPRIEYHKAPLCFKKPSSLNILAHTL